MLGVYGLKLYLPPYVSFLPLRHRRGVVQRPWFQDAHHLEVRNTAASNRGMGLPPQEDLIVIANHQVEPRGQRVHEF